MKNLSRTFLISITLTFFSVATFAKGNVDAGQNKSAVCAACHGNDGNSSLASFPKIAGLGEKYLLKQLLDMKSGLRDVPEMTAIAAGLTEQDMADLAAFYATQDISITGAQEKQVQLWTGQKVSGLKLGEQIYRAGNEETNVPACSGCHSPTGLGNAPAAYPRLGGQFSEYIAKQLKDFRAGKRVNDGDSMMMRGVAKNMSDAEIDAVAAYISGLYIPSN